VTNKAPTFISSIPASLGSMYINGTLPFDLPGTTDNEGHSITVSLSSPPSWIDLIGN